MPSDKTAKGFIATEWTTREMEIYHQHPQTHLQGYETQPELTLKGRAQGNLRWGPLTPPSPMLQSERQVGASRGARLSPLTQAGSPITGPPHPSLPGTTKRWRFTLRCPGWASSPGEPLGRDRFEIEVATGCLPEPRFWTGPSPLPWPPIAREDSLYSKYSLLQENLQHCELFVALDYHT